MRRAIVASVFVLAALATGLVGAQQGASKATGKVKDDAGKGIAGAKITITNIKQKNLTYSQESDKRGEFWFDHLPFNEASDHWLVTVAKEGHVPVKASVKSRTSNRTLLDQYEKKLGREDATVEVPLKAFGLVELEFTLLPADRVPEAPTAQEAAPVMNVATPSSAQPGPIDPYAEARQHIAQGDFQGAADLLQKAVEAMSDDPERREVYGWVLNKLGKTAEAEAQASRAVELAPGRASAHLLLGDLHAARGDYARAAEAFQKAKAVEPENVKVLERIAWVADVTGNADEAIAANEAIVKLSPQNVGAWMSLGDLYHRKGHPDKAEAAYKKVVELDPTNAYKTFFNLGALIENRANLTDAENRKAIEAFRKAVEIKPDYAVAHRHLAYALLRANDLEGTKKELETYLTLAPGAPDAREIREVLASLGGKPPLATKRK